MTGCGHIRLDLGGYVLGALEPDEAEAVREHLERCADCVAEHARLAALPGLLALADGLEGAPAEAPPQAIEERVLDAVARERGRPARPRRRRAWRPRVLAAGAVAVAAAAVALFVLTGDEEGSAPAYGVRLQPVAGSAASARAALESIPGGTAVHLQVDGLPGDPSTVYEVRCDAPGWTASAGTFRVDTRGKAYVVLTTAARRGEYDAIRVVRRSRDAQGKLNTTTVLEAQLS
jgi:hypothetical protein